MVEEEAAYLPHRQTKGTVVVLVVFWLSGGQKSTNSTVLGGKEKKRKAGLQSNSSPLKAF